MASDEGKGGYLVVEADGTKHLPTTRDGKPDHGLMGGAWAALHGGYRGNKYDGPGKEAAISKLRALYKREGIPTPDEKETTSAFSTFAVVVPEEPPEWIELIPKGHFSAVDGRGPFENITPDELIVASLARMPEMGAVIDYDHSTDLAAPEGRPAPAAGWIKALKNTAGSIMAQVEWTREGAAAIKEKLWRYISPVFDHDKEGKINCILHAALTNNPALIQLKAIASAQPAQQRQTMAKKKMKFSEAISAMEAAFPDGTPEQHVNAARCYGLMGDGEGDGMAAQPPPHAEPDGDEPETAEAMAKRHEEEMARCSDDEMRAECTSRHAAEKEAMAKRTASRMSKPEEASRMSAKPAPKEDINAIVAKHPMVVQMASDLNAMRLAQARETAVTAVDKAIRDGRLVPSLRDWGIERCTADPKDFEKFIGASPRILQQGADGKFTGIIGEPKPGPGSFNSKQIEIFAGLGLESPEQLEKCAAVQSKWDLKFPRPILRLDDSNTGKNDGGAAQ